MTGGKKMKKTKLLVLALLAVGTMICACSCNQNKDSGENVAPTEYDESGFQGSGMSGVPDLFDRVGYGTEASYRFGEDGSVTLNGNFYAPIKNSRTAEGKVIETTISRADRQSEATQSPLTGAVYFLSESVRYRLYVVGENTEYSYFVINGIKSVSGGNSVNYERRYKIPLAGYKTGEPIKMKVVLTDGECDVTLAAAASRIYCKITDKTSYESTSGFETSLTYFFGSGEKAVGLESLDVSACFSDTSLLLGDEYANTELDRQKLSVSISNVTDGQNSVAGGSVSVSEEKPFRGSSVKVCVAPKEGYYLDSLKINGENYKNRLTPTIISGVENYVYEIAGIQTDTLIAATFKSGEEKKYLVCGEYVYSSGIYDENSGKCTNDGDELTVSAGIYRGTAANGSFEIYLPDGEHFINLESKFFPAAEIGHREGTHVALDFAPGGHDSGTPSALGHEGLHREVGRDAVLELHTGHVVVALVVVHLEYTAPVVGGAQYLPDGIVLPAALLGQVEGIDVLPFLDVDIQSRVGAFTLVRTVVDTAFGGPFGHVFALEIGK